MKKCASNAYSLCLYESLAIIASIEWILTSFSKWEQFKNIGYDSSSCLLESAVVVFFDALDPTLLLIAALLLLALDFLLYPPNFDFSWDFPPAFEILVLAKDVLLMRDDLD